MDDEIAAEIDGAIQAQVGEAEVTFETEQDDPSGLVKVWEMGDFRAELKYLTKPDTGEPFESPWHVKVIGPDPLAGGRVDSIWSRSYDERDAAEGAAVGKLRDKFQRHQNRQEMGQIDRSIDRAIETQCPTCGPAHARKKDDEDDDDYWGQTLGGDDFAVPAEACDPLLVFDIDGNGRWETEERLDLEADVASPAAMGYVAHNVYSVVHGGPGKFGNIMVVASLPTAESWAALERKVGDTMDVLEDEGWVDDPRHDVSISLEGGDAESFARRMGAAQ